MDFQGGGHQAGPGSGAQPALGRDPARGFPPGWTPPQGTPQPGPPPQASGNEYSPISGYRQQDYLPATPPHRVGRGDRDGTGSRRLLRRPLALGAGVVVLAALAAAGFLLFGRQHSTVIHPGSSLALPTSNPTANSPYFDTKLGMWQHIGSRKLDPVPLSVSQLYPPRFMPTGGSQYTRVATSVDKDCTLAVFGTNLQTALQSGKCTQVVRATYVSGDDKMMGTIGVVNLTSANAAQKAGKTTGAAELIAPLSTSKGPTKNLLSGTGVVYAEVKGHYLILMYAEFTNLKSPKTDAQKQQLVDFAKGMFGGSANIELSNRMLTGKP